MFHVKPRYAGRKKGLTFVLLTSPGKPKNHRTLILSPALRLASDSWVFHVEHSPRYVGRKERLGSPRRASLITSPGEKIAG